MSTSIDGNGRICIEPADAPMRYALLPHAGAAEWPTHAHSTRQSVVALKRLMCLICGGCGSCSGANGAARCDGVALTLVQADRVSPARTRTAAEATSGPIVVS